MVKLFQRKNQTSVGNRITFDQTYPRGNLLEKTSLVLKIIQEMSSTAADSTRCPTAVLSQVYPRLHCKRLYPDFLSSIISKKSLGMIPITHCKEALS